MAHKDGVPDGGNRSRSKKTVTLRIQGTDEELVLPCFVVTTVIEVKQMVADRTLVEVGNIELIRKMGVYYKKLYNDDQISAQCWVKGIKSFDLQKVKWPHPIGFIGAGYHSLKQAFTWILEGDENFVMFDRHERAGGYCWLDDVNKTSRLQTEFGSFHIWFGSQALAQNKCGGYPNCGEGGWHIWPNAEEMLKMFDVAVKDYGILPYIKFKTNVHEVNIEGWSKKADDRFYNLVCNKMDNPKDWWKVQVSVVLHFPGSLTRNRIVEFPGEEVFEGMIRYGMGDDTPYEHLPGSRCAILGNGAFAVENARTAIECGGTKAYIITRRKNLAAPRLGCWFVHQAPMPVPACKMLKTFEPMYEVGGWESVWDFWSVHSNKDRTHTTIMQSSRFGIGDVTFLMTAWGLLEYKVGTVERFTTDGFVLSTGERMHDIKIVLKALGLLGDPDVDRIHKLKELTGSFCDTDFRRRITCDDPGMNAANFTSFSGGMPQTDNGLQNKALYDHPKMFHKAEENGIWDTVPRHRAEDDPAIQKPAYVTEVKYTMASSILLMQFCPQITSKARKWDSQAYKHQMFHKTHGTDRVLEVAKFEWDRYQEDWKSRGVVHDYVSYPYTKEMVKTWFDEYNQVMGFGMNISIDGPGPNWSMEPWYEAAEQAAMEKARLEGKK